MTSAWLPESVFHATRHMAAYSEGKEQTKHLDATFDLATCDGSITSTQRVTRNVLQVTVVVAKISPNFAGWNRPEEIRFILKSSITQLGVDAHDAKVVLGDRTVDQTITVSANLVAIDTLGILTLDYISVGCYIGKLFVPLPNRRIVSTEYIDRLVNGTDMHGKPLLVYGSSAQDPKWTIKVVQGRVVAFLPVRPGVLRYAGGIHGLLPTIGVALQTGTNYKEMLRLHQEFREGHTRIAVPGQVLMVRSYAMHLRTMFGRVVDELLPAGLRCMSSTIIEPESELKDKNESSTGRTFVFHGSSDVDLTEIPVEFFSLESYREHVAFSMRTRLPAMCSSVNDIVKVFKTAPVGADSASTFISKGGMFNHITSKDWVTSNPTPEAYVGNADPERQQVLAEKYMLQQSEYGILSAIAVGDITSDGVLLTRYFPSPVLKSLMLSFHVHRRVRAIYFLQASRHHGSFFSQQDAAMLVDLHTFGISVFHVDEKNNEMYQFMKKLTSDCGLMVPLSRRAEYLESTSFGVYGSNLIAGDFEVELHFMLNGILQLRKHCKHPYLNPEKPLCVVTGGGPGAMEVGNRVAKSLGILSCGLFVDFGSLACKPGATINEQKKNPYVEAYMTYRPGKLVERQSDFNLDFPIFLTGGIGTDFEYALEEVRRKVGTTAIHPLILFGSVEHWTAKITHRFQENLRSGTIKGSQWLSTVPWVVQNGRQALAVYSKFFQGTLPIGPDHPWTERGFMIADDAFVASA